MQDRLSRKDWIDAGLKALRQDGPAALAADRMSKRLGVSRGSFYWHFANAGAFASAVLAEWEELWTARIIKAVEGASTSPREQLANLIGKTSGLDARIYSGVKAMAQKDAEVAAGLKRIDDRRIEFVAKILKSGGIAADEASVRARIIYAWAMGHMLTSHDGSSVPLEISTSLTAFAFHRAK